MTFYELYIVIIYNYIYTVYLKQFNLMLQICFIFRKYVKQLMNNKHDLQIFTQDVCLM